MRITDLDQEDADIDWFAVDAAGHVLHFASGGGVLPASVAASEADLMTLHEFFLTRPETADAATVQVEPNAEQSGRSYQSALRYAQRGLFSFDKTRLTQRQDPHYHLVARPARRLTVAELPVEVGDLLRRTQLPVDVAGRGRIDISSIG